MLEEFVERIARRPKPSVLVALPDQTGADRIFEHIADHCASVVGIAQHAIVAWTEENGRTIEGPMREIYVDDPAVVASADVRTEVGVPLET